MGNHAAAPPPFARHRIRPAPFWRMSLFLLLLGLEAPVHGASLPPGPQAASPTSVIHLFDQSLLASMQAGARAGFTGRYRLLEPVIRRTIAWSAMLHLLTGRDWEQFSPAQRLRLRQLFIHYTIANYAHEFSGYEGQRFEIIKHRHYPAYDLVIARFNEKNHRHHTFVYLLQKVRSTWRVVNIFVDGVSNISLLKSQFQFMVRKSGPEGLFDYLTRSIHRLESSPGPSHRSHAP